jgi:hypothetical protein
LYFIIFHQLKPLIMVGIIINFSDRKSTKNLSYNNTLNVENWEKGRDEVNAQPHPLPGEGLTFLPDGFHELLGVCQRNEPQKLDKSFWGSLLFHVACGENTYMSVG